MNNSLFTTLTLAFSLIFVAGQTLAATAAAPVINQPGNPESGEAQSAVCAACHGADGNSPVPNFPKLAGLGEKYLTKQLQDIQAGNKQMADLQAGLIEEKDMESGTRPVVEMAGLLQGKSLQELKDMAAFYNSKSIQISGSKPQQVLINAGIKVDGLVLGERIYRSGNMETGVPACSACHSPRGLGNQSATYPRLSGQYPEYIAKQLRAFRAGERTNDGDSLIMRQVAQQMSDAEIDAVANFIAGLN